MQSPLDYKKGIPNPPCINHHNSGFSGWTCVVLDPENFSNMKYDFISIEEEPKSSFKQWIQPKENYEAYSERFNFF